MLLKMDRATLEQHCIKVIKEELICIRKKYEGQNFSTSVITDDEVTLDTKINSTPFVDSLDALAIWMAIELHFTDYGYTGGGKEDRLYSKIAGVGTVRDAVDLIERYLPNGGSNNPQ